MKTLLGISFFLFARVFAASSDVSETLGHHIVDELKKNPVDINKVIEGMQKANAGEKAPLSEEEYQKEVLSLKEKQKQEQDKIIFESASAFLQKNANEKNVVEVLKGKLQYQILKQGNGKKIEIYNTPLIRLKGFDLNGNVIFNESEMLLSFDDLIPDLNKLILDMKESEKRKIFFHPSLGFFKDSAIYPKKLMILEIEILKSDKASLIANETAEKKVR